MRQGQPIRPTAYRLSVRMSSDGLRALLAFHAEMVGRRESIVLECLEPYRWNGVSGWEMTIPLRPGDPRITGVHGPVRGDCQTGTTTGQCVPSGQSKGKGLFSGLKTRLGWTSPVSASQTGPLSDAVSACPCPEHTEPWYV